MARGRDLMRFYCSDDVTGAIVQAVVEWKTLDSIYRVCQLASVELPLLPLSKNPTTDKSQRQPNN